MRVRHWDRLGNGGVTFTEIGFGAAPLGNLYRAISEDTAQAALARARDGGVRYFDTAPLYGFGLSETRLNSFLRDKPRDDYIISTKVGRHLQMCPPALREGQGKWFEVHARRGISDDSYDGVMRALEVSLERLGLDRVDILYAHDTDLLAHGSQAALDLHLASCMAGGYRALTALRDHGVIRAIGAGAKAWQPCQWLLERGDFDLFLLAGRHTLPEQEAQASFLPMAEARGVGVVIGGPYNSGIPATGPRAAKARAAKGCRLAGGLRAVRGPAGRGGLPVSADASGGRLGDPRRAKRGRDGQHPAGGARRGAARPMGGAAGTRAFYWRRRCLGGTGGLRRGYFYREDRGNGQP